MIATLNPALPPPDQIAEFLYRQGIADQISVTPPDAQLSPKSTLSPSALGKSPGVRKANGLWVGYDWRNAPEPNIEGVRKWLRDGANIGLKAGQFPGVDIDCRDAVLAGRIAYSALTHLGEAPVRIGNPPKQLLMYRASEPFNRMRLKMEKGEGDEKVIHLVEILGEGQQYVVSGTHPVTKRPYDWGQTLNDVLLLGDGLTEITRERARQWLLALADTLRVDGWKCDVTGDGMKSTSTTPDQARLLAPSMEALTEVVMQIPNEALDYDYWIKMGYAIKAAAGAVNEREAFALWCDWSDKLPTEKTEDIERSWHRLKGDKRVGWPWLAEQAQAAGVNVAAVEFDADPTATLSQPNPAAPLPTRGERITALLHDAGAVLLDEADDLPDGQLRQRLEVLERAESAVDPHDQIFFGTVVPAARNCASFHRRAQFCRILDARLRESAGWASLGENDRETLLQAAYVLVVGPAPLSAPTPRLIPLSGSCEPPADLVSGLFPRVGVAMVFGPPNTGKSFVAGKLALGVASGDGTFAGQKIQSTGPALVFAGEDPEGTGSRFRADAAMHGRSTDRVFLFDRVLNLTDIRAALTQVRAANRAARITESPAIIVVDTLRDAMGTADENDAAAAATAIRIARVIARMFGALVMVIHHSPHSDSGRARGSVAFGASVDAALAVGQSGNPSRPPWRRPGAHQRDTSTSGIWRLRGTKRFSAMAPARRTSLPPAPASASRTLASRQSCSLPSLRPVTPPPRNN